MLGQVKGDFVGNPSSRAHHLPPSSHILVILAICRPHRRHHRPSAPPSVADGDLSPSPMMQHHRHQAWRCPHYDPLRTQLEHQPPFVVAKHIIIFGNGIIGLSTTCCLIQKDTAIVISSTSVISVPNSPRREAQPPSRRAPLQQLHDSPRSPASIKKRSYTICTGASSHRHLILQILLLVGSRPPSTQSQPVQCEPHLELSFPLPRTFKPPQRSLMAAGIGLHCTELPRSNLAIAAAAAAAAVDLLERTVDHCRLLSQSVLGKGIHLRQQSPSSSPPKPLASNTAAGIKHIKHLLCMSTAKPQKNVPPSSLRRRAPSSSSATSMAHPPGPSPHQQLHNRIPDPPGPAVLMLE